MANLLSWAGNLANRVGNTVNNDVIQPVVRDVYQPIVRDVVQPAQQTASRAENTLAAAGAGLGGLARVGAGAITNNYAAEQNALNATNQAIQARLAANRAFLNWNQAQQGGFHLIKPTLSAAAQIAPYVVAPELKGATALRSIAKPAATFGGLNAAGTALQGGNRNQIIKSGLLGAGAGAAGGVAGELYGFNKALPKNELGAVGKNVGMPKDFLKQDAKAIAQNARILNTTKAKAAEALRSKLPPEQKAVVNKALSKMPSIPEVPKSSAKPGQELKPMSELPVAKKLFSNKVNALRQINTKSSHEAANRMVAAEADRQAIQAQWMHSIPTVRSLSKGDFRNFVDTVEKTAKANNPKVAQAVKEWKALTPKIAREGQSQGFLLNGARQNFFPHQYDIIREGSTQWDNMIQHLMDTRQINHTTAVDILRSHNNDVKAGHFGSLENSRETNMPGYHKDIHAVNKYIGGAAGRIADARHFGNDAQIASKLVENTRIEGGDAKSAEAALRNYLVNPDKGGKASRALSGARSAFGAASLSKAPISHLGQTSNVAVESGVARTVKAWGKFLSQNREAKDFIDRVGATNPQELHAYRDQFTSVRGAMSKVTAAGLTPVMKMNRSVATLAGREYGHFLASKGNIEALRGLGVTGDIGKTLTKNQEIQAARGLVNHTMFSGSRATTPIYAETPAGKTVGQFRTAYAYKQTGFIYNQVIKAAQQGDLKPLIRFLGVSSAITAGTVTAKNKISGNKEGPGGIAMDVLGSLLGIPGEAALQLGRYGLHKSGDLTQAVAGEVAPLASEFMTLGGNIDQAVHGKPAALERTALKAIPIIGGRAAQTLVPSKKAPAAASNPSAPGSTTGTSAALPKNSAQAQKQSTTLVDNLKNNAKQGGYGLGQLPNGKYYYQLSDGSVSTTSNLKNARLAIQKDQFVQSGKNEGVIGNNVWQLDSNGNPTHQTIAAYQYSYTSAQMTQAKDNGNLTAYLSLAQTQLKNIQKQLSDPNTTPLKALQLQNDAATLQKNIAKYNSYGGFTKATGTKTGGSKKSKSYTLNLPSASKTKAPKVKTKFKTTTKGTTFKPKAPPKVRVAATPKVRATKRKLA